MAEICYNIINGHKGDFQLQYTFKTREKDRGLKLSKFLKNQGVSIALIKKVKFNRDGITVDGVKQNTDYRL